MAEETTPRTPKVDIILYIVPEGGDFGPASLADIVFTRGGLGCTESTISSVNPLWVVVSLYIILCSPSQLGKFQIHPGGKPTFDTVRAFLMQQQSSAVILDMTHIISALHRMTYCLSRLPRGSHDIQRPRKWLVRGLVKFLPALP